MTAVLHLPEQKVILKGVSWETYERLLAEHEEESGTRFTYDSGILEILVPSARHEKPHRILASLGKVLAEEMALNIESLGSTTLKRPALLQGFAPDSCFYIQHADAIRDNEEIDFIACSHNTAARWLLSLIFLLSISSASFGQPQAEGNKQGSQPVFQGESPVGGAYEPQHQEAEKKPPYEDLLAKAKARGNVRVIVRLKLDDWKAEGDLPNEQAVARQREEIAHLQARLLNSMASLGVGDVKQFTFVPQVAMQVNAAGLQELLAHPDVTGIWEDVPFAPGR